MGDGRWRGWVRRLACLAVMALGWQAGVAHAQGDELEEAGVAQEGALRVAAQVAFGGHYRNNRFATTMVALENQGGDVALDVAAISASGSRVVPVDLARGGRKLVQLTMPAPRFGGWRVEVRPRGEERALVRVTPSARAVPEGRRVLAFVGKRPPGLRRDLKQLLEADPENFDEDLQPRVARATLEELPEEAGGYEVLDALFWVDPRPDRLSPAQLEAMMLWVSRGGHLVVAVDEGWRQLSTSPLAEILPARMTGTTVLEGEQVGGALGYWLADSGWTFEEGKPLPERLTLLEGEVRAGAGPGTLSFSGDHPLTWSWRVGTGRVTLWRTLPERIGGSLTLERWGEVLVGDVRVIDHTAAWDALRVDEPKLEFNIFGLLAILLLYIIIIGPVDYLVLRRLRRLEWTAVTYPATILVFSALAWLAMTGSVEQGSFQARLDLVTWHLPSGAVSVGEEPRERPLAGVVDVGVYAGHFSTKRARLEFSTPQREDRLWVNRGPYDSMGLGNEPQQLFGVPARLSVVAPAYALTPVQIDARRRSQIIPVEIRRGTDEQGREALMVTNRLSGPLRTCTLRLGIRSLPKPFDLEPGQSSPWMALADSLVTYDSMRQSWDQEEQWRQNIDTATSDRGGLDKGGELVCEGALGQGVVPEVALDGPQADETRRRAAVSFVF